MKARRVWGIVACVVLLAASVGLARAQEPVTEGTAAALAGHVIGDVDGDGKTDIGVYGTNNGDWWILKSITDYSTYLYRGGWGGTGWTPVSGDFDGDALMDLAVYNDSGDWWILTSLSGYTNYIYRAGWGGAGYIPLGGLGGPSWLLAGNKGTTSSNYIGTNDNQALEFKVNGARALRLEPNSTSPNLIGGYSGNSVTSGAVGATIGGGGEDGWTNRVTDEYGTVGGGTGNQAGDGAGTTHDRPHATVGGGYDNLASGDTATVSGGEHNIASMVASTVGGGGGNSATYDYATVSGGEANTASYWDATVGGGFSNTASASNTTVGGGAENTASGDNATVPGGVAASATHYAEMAYASGRFFNYGDAQTSVYVLRKATTDATATQLFLDGGSQRLTVASGRTLTFDILVVARSDAGASAGYRAYGVIENSAGTTAFIGTPTVTVLGEDVAAWNVTVVADNTNAALVIQVTGAAATTIRWVATVRTVEVAW